MFCPTFHLSHAFLSCRHFITPKVNSFILNSPTKIGIRLIDLFVQVMNLNVSVSCVLVDLL